VFHLWYAALVVSLALLVTSSLNWFHRVYALALFWSNSFRFAKSFSSFFPYFSRFFINFLSFSMARGQVHLSLPVCVVCIDTYLTEMSQWFIGTELGPIC
jgi:hypothetical protein